MDEKENNVKHFLDLVKKSRRGKFKVYIGMSAGVGKTYRMLQEAHTLLKNGIDIKIGYVETHKRAETEALVEGIPMIPQRKLFYKGKELEELDIQAVINARPEIVIVDELAHTNIEGSKNPKRWQDVQEILEAGINVISAINIQHIESLNEDVKDITGVEVKERVPDSILQMADEVVNIDLTSDELITRLKEGKIYTKDKINLALNNFFKSDQILQLRELALKEVAGQVLRKVESEIPSRIQNGLKHEKILACISSNDKKAKTVIRKSARLAIYYNSKWKLLYVQTPNESPTKIPLDKQRFLINNFKLANDLGAEVVKIENSNVAETISNFAIEKGITTICIGKPKFSVWKSIFGNTLFHQMLRKISGEEIDLVILG
jgi:two-component system, OmpR family, sensor histidine kinase KdpD